MSSKQIGILGERIAENYLKQKGNRILDKNYSWKIGTEPQKGEIDIIARPRRNIIDFLRGKKNDAIHFVEVKTLRLASHAQSEAFLPEDKVDFSKQQKIIKTAQSWLVKNKILFNTPWQIDIISITLDQNSRKAKIRHLENAVA